MGSTVSAYTIPYHIVTNVSNFVRGTKRKFNERDTQEDVEKIIDIEMRSPKRKKIESTSQYIYKVLFKEGKNSDVILNALGETFLLHKIYLCQSPYFASMFGGSWLETKQKSITIDIVDPLITVNSLRIVFGSLYCDEIILSPVEIVHILATATMFQLDGIIDKCREVMLETINPKTALHYYIAGCQYGDNKLKDSCIRWFLINLMGYFYNLNKIEMLRSIPISLMAKLVSHPDLCVMKTEITLYVLLTQWMYLHLHPEEDILVQDISNYFISRKHEKPFLLTQEGQNYVCVFQNLRLQHLISHYMDVELLFRDNVLPHGWIHNVVLNQWRATLKVNQNEEKGPTECSDEAFLNTSLRCGRTLESREKHMWRWTGFHYGVDLVMIADEHSLTVKRNHRPEFEQLLSLQTIRHVDIRVTVYTLNEQRQITYCQCSGIKHLPLEKGEEVTLLTYEQIHFPIIISANILFLTSGEKDGVFDTIQTLT